MSGAKNTRWPACVVIDTNESVHSSGQACFPCQGQRIQGDQYAWLLTLMKASILLDKRVWQLSWGTSVLQLPFEHVCLTVILMNLCVWQLSLWACVSDSSSDEHVWYICSWIVWMCVWQLCLWVHVFYNYFDECMFDSYHCDHVFYNCPCEYVCLTIIIMNKCIWQLFWWFCVNSL